MPLHHPLDSVNQKRKLTEIQIVDVPKRKARIEVQKKRNVDVRPKNRNSPR